uniref:Uncharacterized protein n=1 Tax=Utricularia reniformis TaxID=192314 RepID=A0A1Y0AYW1_9LAMI|nr:hypothetical protein AEK19_MT1058 [Utricularia reniformis]ART30344.1 hypothetical protein AEK19_MT1058 [Utricularia reniformis]
MRVSRSRPATSGCNTVPSIKKQDARQAIKVERPSKYSSQRIVPSPPLADPLFARPKTLSYFVRFGSDWNLSYPVPHFTNIQAKRPECDPY